MTNTGSPNIIVKCCNALSATIMISLSLFFEIILEICIGSFLVAGVAAFFSGMFVCGIFDDILTFLEDIIADLNHPPAKLPTRIVYH